MLFQPSNVFPDSLGELGNGVVDISDSNGLSVSWEINGNSPMVAYSVTIYANDSSSTQKITTGKLTTNCPFYGTDYAGNKIRFSHKFTSTQLSSAGLSNGNSYKIIIKQWYTSNDAVTQSSASVFITRSTPSLVIDAISNNTVTKREHTFSATYTQAQNDALNWVRWQIAYSDNLDSPIYDSHNIFSTAQLMMPYDGFFTGYTYAVRCMAETVNGVYIESSWKIFSVSYESTVLPAVASAQRVSSESTAVKVTWNGFKYIYAKENDAQYNIIDGILKLDSGSIYWDEENGVAMSYSTPWSLLYKISVLKYKENKVLLSLNNGAITVNYIYASRCIRITFGSTNTLTTSTYPVVHGDNVLVCISPSKVAVAVNGPFGGLEPSDTLVPSETLVPYDSYTMRTWMQSASYSSTQPTISKIELLAKQECDYIKVVNGTIPDSDVDDILDGTIDYKAIPKSLFYTDFEDGLNAGTLSIGDEEIIGWAIYRKSADDLFMKHLTDVALEVSSIYDYGCGSQQGPYTYYVYPIGENTYVTNAIISNSISPCFWNWSIIEAEKSGEKYNAIAEYVFGKNLSSGEISNNNTPNVVNNFTRYPTVQLSALNYMSGSLSSLIGKIYIDSDGNIKYSDTLNLRNEIWNLSTTTHHLFLKSRKGDVIQIRTNSAISMGTSDELYSQAQTVSLGWVQVGAGEGLSITSTKNIARI